MDWLDYFTASPDALQKTPHLLLVGDRGADLSEPDHLQGAVLLYEYRFAGRRTGVFATDDADGVRTVVAPRGVRLKIAEIAVRWLMAQGAVAVLASVGGVPDVTSTLAEERTFTAATRLRIVPRYLPLANTLDATLAQLGHRTRKNLRYYRRRAVAELGASFVPHVEMSLEQILDFNRRSRNPAEDEIVRWRFRLLERSGQSPNTMFAGLRMPNGQWLSLIGGRRHGTTTEIDWQMNAADFPDYSLCTVMRSFMLEQEIARGATRLEILGGTPHPMRHSFTNIVTTDILALRRHSARAWLLDSFSPWIFPEKNFLRCVLADDQMRRAA